MRKTIWILTLLLVQRMFLYPQNVEYPLNVGDRWRYYYLYVIDSTHYFADSTEARVVKDTIMNNGNSFKLIDAWWYDFGRSYQRVSGNQVFTFVNSTQEEHLLFDFSRSIGDTISYYYNGFDSTMVVLIDTFSGNIYGHIRLGWYILIDRLVQSVDDEVYLTIVDSIGVTHVLGYGFDYRIQGAVINGRQYGRITDVKRGNYALPFNFYLHQNYPNPFNPSTTISYTLPERSIVTLNVFNTLGQEVALPLVNVQHEAGEQKIEFNATSLPSGIYYYRITASGNQAFTQTKKMVVLK
jgi:hypothetical protein